MDDIEMNDILPSSKRRKDTIQSMWMW